MAKLGHGLETAATRNSRPSVEEKPPHIFGSVALRIGNTSHSKRWRELLAEQGQKYLAQACGSDAVCASPTLERLKQVREKASRHAEGDTVELVNRAVNETIKYRSDVDLYGMPDYWAGFRETVERGMGDCEDIAVVKMWMLHSLGMPLERMHLVLANSEQLRANHAILIVQSEDAVIVLDNLTNKVLADDGSRRYRPLLTLGVLGEWTHGFVANVDSENPARLAKITTSRPSM